MQSIPEKTATKVAGRQGENIWSTKLKVSACQPTTVLEFSLLSFTILDSSKASQRGGISALWLRRLNSLGCLSPAPSVCDLRLPLGHPRTNDLLCSMADWKQERTNKSSKEPKQERHGTWRARPTDKSFLKKTKAKPSSSLLWRSWACLNHIWSIQHNRTKADATITQMSESLRKPKWPASHLTWKHYSATDFKRSIFVLEGLAGGIRTEFSVLIYCRCQ